MPRLTVRTMRAHARRLAALEPRFGAVIDRFGYPPLWDRTPGFATLVLMILEQQVSLASARAAFDRLTASLGEVTPAGVLMLSDAEMKAIGFSRQKARYARILAGEIRSGRLDPDALESLSDDAVHAVLTSITGIGPWTAAVYTLMVLRRPDVWPPSDIALAAAAADLFDLPERPTSDALQQMAVAWAPYRSTAARLLWHHYLSR